MKFGPSTTKTVKAPVKLTNNLPTAEEMTSRIEVEKELEVTTHAPVHKMDEEAASPKEFSLGNPHGYVYLEVELDGINIGATAKKIALMTQNNLTFYGEITEDAELKKQCVLEGDVWRVYGSKKTVSAQLNFWLEEYMSSGLTQCIQFVCNVGTYKFPAFLDILTNGEGATKMKSYITPICYELTVDISNAVAMFNPTMKEYPLQSSFVLDNRRLVFEIMGEEFEIKADEKVVNDLVVTSIIHKYIWALL